MHARCGYVGASNHRTVFIDLNDVNRKLKPLSRNPIQFVSKKGRKENILCHHLTFNGQRKIFHALTDVEPPSLSLPVTTISSRWVIMQLAGGNGTKVGWGGSIWVNFFWVCAVGLSEPLPRYSLFCGQL